MGTRINEIVAGVGQTNIAPVTPYEAIIANTATTYPQDVFVTIPSIDQGRTLKGAVRWTPLTGHNGELIFPTKDDIASVIRTQEGYYWVTNFIPTAFPAAIDMATQAELNTEKARIAALEALTPRFVAAYDGVLRQTSSATVTEIVNNLRISVPPTAGTWEFDMEFQWESGTGNTRINFELWDVSGSVNLGSARGGMFTSTAGRNVRASFRAYIPAATFGVSTRTMTMGFSSPDGALVSVRGDVAPTSFTATEHR